MTFKPKYTLVKSPSSGMTGIRCETCHMTSYNPNDVENKYCGYCHKFLADPPANATAALQDAAEK